MPRTKRSPTLWTVQTNYYSPLIYTRTFSNQSWMRRLAFYDQREQHGIPVYTHVWTEAQKIFDPADPTLERGGSQIAKKFAWVTMPK